MITEQTWALNGLEEPLKKKRIWSSVLDCKYKYTRELSVTELGYWRRCVRKTLLVRVRNEAEVGKTIEYQMDEN
jgi:hypothetical protein